MHVGHDTSPGWSLLPLTVNIVLTLVNSTVSPVEASSVSTRPRSAALLPVSTASTGLLRLSVGAHVHRVRSNTGNCRMWPLPCTHIFIHILWLCHSLHISLCLTFSRYAFYITNIISIISLVILLHHPFYTLVMPFTTYKLCYASNNFVMLLTHIVTL